MFNFSFQDNKPSDFKLNDFGQSPVGGASPAAAAAEAKRDFSNPMYDAMGTMESQAAAEAARGGSSGLQIAGVTTDSSSSDYTMEPPSAVMAPSGGVPANQSSSPQLGGGGGVLKHKELAPTNVDTGKDTQCLVEEQGDEEEDDSEC